MDVLALRVKDLGPALSSLQRVALVDVDVKGLQAQLAVGAAAVLGWLNGSRLLRVCWE